MSNMPTLPDADVQEPIPDERYDDDVVGVPMDDDGGVGSDLPEPSVDPTPSDVQPGGADETAGGTLKPL